MYILTVLLHKKWDGHKLQTDEMSRHCHYRSELSFRRKKDLRCTAHTTISLSSQVMSVPKKKEKWGRGREKGLPFTTEENQQARNTTKSDLVAAPNIHTQTSRWVKTRLNWPWFHKHIPFSTGLSCTKEFWLNLILNKSFPQYREIMISFQFRNTAIPISYCTTGRWDPLKATMVT